MKRFAKVVTGVNYFHLKVPSQMLDRAVNASMQYMFKVTRKDTRATRYLTLNRYFAIGLPLDKSVL